MSTERTQLIEKIKMITNKLGIKEMSGFEDVNFSNIGRSLSRLMTEEIEVLANELELLYQEYLKNTPTESVSQNENTVAKSKKIKKILKVIEKADIRNVPGFEEIEFSRKDLASFQLEMLENSELDMLQEIIESVANSYFSKKHEETLNKRIEKILNDLEELNITEVEGYSEILISDKNQAREKMKTLSHEELDHIEEFVDEIKEKQENNFFEGQYEIIDPLEVIDKYRNGINVEEETKQEIDDYWRNEIPKAIKKNFPDWRTADIETVYDESKKFMLSINRTFKEYEEIQEFVSELSRIIFAEPEEAYEEDDDKAIITNEVEDSIMSLIEMIILPYLEVLESVENRNGKVILKDTWNVPFTESLKEKVKERDNWRCVICESETDLHVHHKIPRKLGGPHHKDNLVTLCSSCHKAIETADIKKAFQKCLANFKKSKYRRNNKQPNYEKNKTLLKEEVEMALEKLLSTLEKKGEEALAEDLVIIIDKLQIIFYD